nr:ATP-binding cassette domain-containing protein [Aquabacterium sp. A08]
MLLPERFRPLRVRESQAYGPALLDNFAAARAALTRAAWLSSPIGLLALLPSIFTLEVFDRVIFRHGMSTLVALLAGVAVALAVEWWFRRRRSTQLREAGALIDWGLSSTLLDRMLSQPLRTLEDRPAAAWMSLFRDVSTVRVLMTGAVVQALFDLPLAIFAVLIIAVVATPVLPVVLVAMTVFGLLAWWWADEVKTGKVSEVQRARNLDMFTAELCRARESVKALAQHEAVAEQWKRNYEQWLGESFAKGTELEESRELSHTLLILTSISITAFGALAVVNQWMTVGGLIAANMLALKAISPIAMLSGAWRQLAQSIEAAKRLDAVFEQPVDSASSQLALPRPKGLVRLEKLTFAFDDQARPVFDEIDLTLQPGRFYAVVGRNGAGKSTLLKLITGLYRPNAGRVMIDEYELQQFSRAETAAWIATLSQNVYFIDGSIADQLRSAAPGTDDQQIVKACKLTGAHAAITRLPQGYATVLREGGRALSAGVRRKIALAQVLLRNPAVLVLDEPSNDLDHDSEMQLIAALKLIAKVRTVVVVTHSQQMVSHADLAVDVTGEGQVQLIGPAAAMERYFSAGKRAKIPETPGEPSHLI